MKEMSAGKHILSLIMITSLCLFLTACQGATDRNQGNGQKDGTDILSTAESVDMTEEESTKEPDAPADLPVSETNGRELQEPSASQNLVRIYRGDDAVERMLTDEVWLPEVTADHLVQALKDAGVLEEGVEVNSMEMAEKEDGTFIDLDFNQVFLEKLGRMGTSGEYFYMGSVVNTFLQAFEARAVRITADGAAPESGHNIYEGYLYYFRPNPGKMEGKYIFTDSSEVIKPYVLLEDDGSFIFEYSILMSSIPAGTYVEEEDQIIMKRQGADAVYVFDIRGENLVYNKEESSQTELQDRAVFEPGY